MNRRGDWIADRTLRAPAMTRGAVIAEGRFAASEREAQELRILDDRGKIGGGDPVAILRLFGFVVFALAAVAFFAITAGA